MMAMFRSIAISLLLATAAFGQAQNVDNVVIVLDASGSMNDFMGRVRKMDAAKSALKEVLKTMPDTTHVGLLVFSSATGNGWIYPLGPKDEAKLNAAIDLPQAKESTPLGTYMKMAADRLLEERKAQFGYGTYRLLVVTDGEANSEPANLVGDYTKDIIGRGIVIDVIGVKMDGDHTLARKVHSYRKADSPESLKKAIGEVFAEVDKAKNAQAGEDTFAEIAGLPDEVAVAAIAAFASSGNHPIGEGPSASTTPSEAAAQPQQAPQSGGSSSSSGSETNKAWYVFGAVVAIYFIIRKLKG